MSIHARDLLFLFRVSFICPNLAFCSMSKALWKGPDCEKLKSTCDNLGAVRSSDVDGKQLYEKSLDYKMLVSSDKLKIIASWSPDNVRIALQIMLTMAVIQYFLQASNDLSVNWNWSFHTSGPRWLTISQGRLCDIALMRIEREETTNACCTLMKS